MKKYIVTTLILLSFIGCKTAKKEAISQKPNILFIMTDDHALAAISAYKGFSSRKLHPLQILIELQMTVCDLIICFVPILFVGLQEHQS